MTANTTKKAATAEPTQPAVWRIEGHDSLFGVESSSVTFRFYRVQRNTYGDLKCCGHSDGERCWPFYQHGVCKHVQAVEAFLDDERAAQNAAKPARKLTLIDLFELSERTSRIERE